MTSCFSPLSVVINQKMKQGQEEDDTRIAVAWMVVQMTAGVVMMVVMTGMVVGVLDCDCDRCAVDDDGDNNGSEVVVIIVMRMITGTMLMMVMVTVMRMVAVVARMVVMLMVIMIMMMVVVVEEERDAVPAL